jgi:hypothetical protein
MRSGATDLQENGARLGGNRAPALSEALGKIRRRRETGPFSERTLVLSAPEAPIAGREPSRVGSETTQTPCPKSTLAETPVYNLLARRQCDRVGPSACAARHTQCRTSPGSPWFAPDPPLGEGGFETSVPRHGKVRAALHYSISGGVCGTGSGAALSLARRDDRIGRIQFGGDGHPSTNKLLGASGVQRELRGQIIVRHIWATGELSNPRPSFGCLKCLPMMSSKSSRSTTMCGSKA